MKNLIVMFCATVVAFSLTSCYAFLHADKLVYQGTIGKKIPPVELHQDSVDVNAGFDGNF